MTIPLLVRSHERGMLCLVALLVASCMQGNRGSASHGVSGVNGISGVVSSASGPEADAVILLLSPEYGNGLVNFALTDQNGRFAFEVSPGSYVVSVSSPRGTSFEPVEAPAAVQVSLRSDCVVVTTEFEGQAELVTSYFVIQYETEEVTPLERYGAKAGKGENAHVCLPAGSYLMTMPDDEFVARWRTIRVDAPMTLEVPVFRISDVTRPPDPPVTLVNGDRRTFLGGFADAQVLGLGEGNHGTREFLEERGRMILDMAGSGELRVVMIEAGFAETLAVNDYVQGRRDDVDAAVAGLRFWMWDTKEFLSFVDDLRTLNTSRAGSDRILLLGFDVQSSPAAVKLVAGAPGLEEAERELVRRLQDDDIAAFRTLSPTERRQLDSILVRTTALESGAVLDSTDFNTGLAAHALLHRIEALDAAWPVSERRARDFGMAKMVESVTAKVGLRKVVLMGHSAHLGKVAGEASDLTMGVELSKSLGPKYAVVGFLSGKGTVRAWDSKLAVGVIANEVPQPEPYMVEAVMVSDSAPGVPTYVDLSKVPTEIREWLAIPRYVREFGAVYPGAAEWAIRLRPILEAYDGLVVFAAGTATTPTPTGERSAKDRKQ